MMPPESALRQYSVQNAASPDISIDWFAAVQRTALSIPQIALGIS